MSSFGPQAMGVYSDFSGSGSFSPVSDEQGVATQGRQGGQGGVLTTMQGVPVSPTSGIPSDIEQIISGIGIGAAGVISIFGTDGALTPVGLSMVAQGLIQVFNGADGLYATYKGGAVQGPAVGGLTSGQAGELTDAATGTWYSSSGVGAAVWGYDLGFGGPDAQAFLEQIQSSLVNLAYDGMAIPAPGRAFVSFGSKVTNVYDAALPNMDVSAFVVGTDTALSWLTRVNPDWTVTVDAGGDTNELVYPGCVRLHRFATAPDVIWCESDAETAALAVGREQWFVDYDGFREYTPSSGPPSRLMFGDMHVLFAMIPVVY